MRVGLLHSRLRVEERRLGAALSERGAEVIPLPEDAAAFDLQARGYDGLDIDSFRFDKSPDATRHIHIDDHRNAGRRVSRDFRAADGAVTA